MADAPAITMETLLAACQAGAAEAGQALGRAFDATIAVSVGAGAAWSELSAMQRGSCDGPGLAIALHVGNQAAALLLPKSSGLLPAWCAAPDATGESKLTTLAQELGMSLLPETAPADDFFKAAEVENLATAVERAQLDPAALAVELTLSTDTSSGAALLLWPLAKPAELYAPAAKKIEAAAQPAVPVAKPAPAAEAAAARMASLASDRAAKLQQLPVYARSLLHIKVPVTVTLAAKKQTTSKILEMGPGAIIHFNKSCEELLDLNVGTQRVAQGEAVKIGDKFGLRVMAISPAVLGPQVVTAHQR